MAEVGIRELKTHTSELVRRVREKSVRFVKRDRSCDRSEG
jgi:hypothetical protein